MVLHDCITPETSPPPPKGVFGYITAYWRCPECKQSWSGYRSADREVIWFRDGRPSIFWQAKMERRYRRMFETELGPRKRPDWNALDVGLGVFLVCVFLMCFVGIIVLSFWTY